MHRYPLVAYLDPALTAKVRALQTKLRELTGSEASLRDWDPHISIGSEVWMQDNEVGEYVSELEAATAGIKPLNVPVAGFGFIDNWSGGKLPGNTPYGIFLRVEVTPDLQALADAVEPVANKRKLYFKRPHPYHPHVTLAFRDLTAAGYKKAVALLESQSFAETAHIDSYSIAKMNPDGKNSEAIRIKFK
jgi:2'-5' RNA ligase